MGLEPVTGPVDESPQMLAHLYRPRVNLALQITDVFLVSGRKSTNTRAKLCTDSNLSFQ